MTYPASRRQYAGARRRPVLDSSTRLMSRTASRTRMRAAAQEPAVLWVYDEIGVEWGVTAAAVATALDGVRGAVQVCINSPGGDVWAGLAIYAALRQHPGQVQVRVDGLAASAASIVAMAASPGQLTAAPNSMFMVHSAWTVTVGDEHDHADAAQLLAKVSDNLAQVYAGRAGGTAAQWRAVMAAETWFDADEAVSAGLADRVAAAGSDREVPAWMTS
jgi:ATP-dependent Clp protease, protease subunit